MRFFKGFLRTILAILLGLSLSGFIASTIFASTIGKPNTLKTWLNASGVYSAGIDYAINQSNKAGEDPNINHPEVQTALRQTFTPEIAKSTVESIIDGTFHWLAGKSPKPDFVLDLTALKNAFAKNAGNALEARVSALPICTNAQLQQFSGKVDPFTITCRPAVFNVELEKQKIIAQIESSPGFLENPVLTADNLKDENGNPIYEKAPNLPKFYRILMLAPWIFAAFSAFFALGIILLSRTRRKGFGRIAVTLLSTGITLLVFIAISSLVINKTTSPDGVFVKNIDPAFQTSGISLIKLLSKSVSNVLLLLGGAFSVLGTSILIYLRITKPKNPDLRPPVTHDEPKELPPPVEPKSHHPGSMG